MHGLRVLVPLLLLALVVAVVSSVLTARPDLRQAKRNVDESWTQVAPDLAQRYALLANATKETAAVSGPVHQVVGEVNAGLARWQTVYGHASVSVQVTAANELEALGRRLLVTAAVSPRVAQDTDAKQALGVFLSDPTVRNAHTSAFNGTVAAYERERRGPVRQVVASVLGDGDVPALDTTNVAD